MSHVHLAFAAWVTSQFYIYFLAVRLCLPAKCTAADLYNFIKSGQHVKGTNCLKKDM